MLGGQLWRGPLAPQSQCGGKAQIQIQIHKQWVIQCPPRGASSGKGSLAVGAADISMTEEPAKEDTWVAAPHPQGRTGLISKGSTSSPGEGGKWGAHKELGDPLEASVQNAGGAVVPLTSAPVRPRLGPGRGRLEEPFTGKGLEAGSGG